MLGKRCPKPIKFSPWDSGICKEMLCSSWKDFILNSTLDAVEERVVMECGGGGYYGKEKLRKKKTKMTKMWWTSREGKQSNKANKVG